MIQGSADLGTSHRAKGKGANGPGSNDLGSSHQVLSSTCTDLGTTHEGEDCAKVDVEETQVEHEEGAGVPLEGTEFKCYQQQAARANYLCLDRPDIGFATKELMRRMSAPTDVDFAALKKLGRYLLGKPRVVSTFRYGESSNELIVEGDSDHAGCLKTRKSTSGGVIRWGSHVLKWWSKTQPTIALSSGEAELAAMVRSTSEGLGMVAIMKEFNLEANLTVKGDAVAAIGIVRRQGLGRIRHLAVADLWIQQRSKDGCVAYSKLEGARNTSDILTKAVEAEVLNRHMAELGLEFTEGRHESTPAYNGIDDGTPC